jgi:hypothetical protein
MRHDAAQHWFAPEASHDHLALGLGEPAPPSSPSTRRGCITRGICRAGVRVRGHVGHELPSVRRGSLARHRKRTRSGDGETADRVWRFRVDVACRPLALSCHHGSYPGSLISTQVPEISAPSMSADEERAVEPRALGRQRAEPGATKEPSRTHPSTPSTLARPATSRQRAGAVWHNGLSRRPRSNRRIGRVAPKPWASRRPAPAWRSRRRSRTRARCARGPGPPPPYTCRSPVPPPHQQHAARVFSRNPRRSLP